MLKKTKNCIKNEYVKSLKEQDKINPKKGWYTVRMRLNANIYYPEQDYQTIFSETAKFCRSNFNSVDDKVFVSPETEKKTKYIYICFLVNKI